MKPKSRRKTLLSSAILIMIGLIFYSLADRYLIRHVEIADVSAYSSAELQANSNETSSSDPERIGSLTPSTPTPVTATADDWNYISEDGSISIREYSMGSGSDTVTYFVADVLLADATVLTSAFADNQFGRNIVAYTSEIAEENDAIFAINGDYYGFRSDGIVIRNGVIYRDEPARIGLAFYRDGTMKIYNETSTSAQALLDAGVWNTLSFGPALVEDGAVVDNLSNVEIDTNFGNHSIQGNNPRTGVGIIDANHFVFIVVDGRSAGYSKGMTLTEFANLFEDLGCSAAYNIDGGGSSTMYFMGRVVNHPLGKDRERGTSDILYIGA